MSIFCSLEQNPRFAFGLNSYFDGSHQRGEMCTAGQRFCDSFPCNDEYLAAERESFILNERGLHHVTYSSEAAAKVSVNYMTSKKAYKTSINYILSENSDYYDCFH